MDKLDVEKHLTSINNTNVKHFLEYSSKLDVEFDSHKCTKLNNIKYRNYEYNNNMVNTWNTKSISVDSKINKYVSRIRIVETSKTR